MKKHIEKKCLFEKDLPEEITDIAKGKGISVTNHIKASGFPKDYNAIIITEDNKMLIGFPVNDSGRMIFIPEPDPILIYFDTAYRNYKQITEHRKTLLNHFKGVKMDESYLIDLYSYYGAVNAFIILLFTAIEAFINYNVPEEYQYVVAGDKKTESYNKAQVMYLPFKTKINIILKEIFKKDFIHAHPPTYQHITNLKEMRDSIVHLKPMKDTNTPYSHIYKKGLGFKFEETLDAVMDFMNFYKPGYITYCSCGKDF